MRFQKLEVLETHVKEAFQRHLSPIYGVICPSEGERKKILKDLSQKLSIPSDTQKFALFKEAIQHLSSASLFSEKVCAIFDGVEFLSKKELELLIQYVKSPNSKGHLILGAGDPKVFNEIYKIGKKEMVILDLSKEKPWEKKERLRGFVLQKLGADRVKIAPDALELFIEGTLGDRLLMEQEIDKLLCYLGSRKQITKTDLEMISCFSEELNIFQWARDLVWEGKAALSIPGDLSILLPLIGQLRHQLEMGLKMSALLQKETSDQEIAKAFPKLWPKALQQVMQGAKEKGGSYFQKGLCALYDLEFGLKTSLCKPEILLAQFMAKINEG